jgi:hypothetical protein
MGDGAENQQELLAYTTQLYTRYSWVITGKKIPYKSLLIAEEIAEVLCGRLFPLISNVVAHLLILLSSNISGDGQVEWATVTLKLHCF